MGSVWLAHDRVLDRTVAIKRIGRAPGPDGDPDPGGPCARPGWPRLSAIPTWSPSSTWQSTDDQQWLVMEYVEGLTLAQLVQRDGPLTPDRAPAC